MSTRVRKHQSEKLLSQLNKTSNELFFGKNTNADVIENQTLKPQSSDLVNIFDRSASR